MDLVFAFVANAAELSREGRVSALGAGIDGVAVSRFPAIVPALALVTKIHFKADECGLTHRVRIFGTSADGDQMVFETTTTIEAQPVPSLYFPERGSNTFSVVWLQNVTAEEPGIYNIFIECDGTRLGKLELAFAATSKPTAQE